MKFQTRTNEVIFISEIRPQQSYMFDQDMKTGLSIIWNRGKTAKFRIDNNQLSIKKNCIIFLTEYHKVEDFQFEKMNVLQFNRPFYCVEEHDDEIGCKGLLFFGAADLPKIEIPNNKEKQFKALWEVLLIEIDEKDSHKAEMLRILLKRLLILCLRIYKKEHHDFPYDDVNVGLIREYNYLVEKHYKSLTKVSDYARLLRKSPKTLSNIFKKYIDKRPLQVINDRRMLEAKRLLKYTNKSIQEIADEINFMDIQAFSHFFRSREGQSPSLYRNKL